MYKENGESRQTGFTNFVVTRLTSRAYKRIQLFMFACWLIFVLYSFSKYGESIAARRIEQEQFSIKHHIPGAHFDFSPPQFIPTPIQQKNPPNNLVVPIKPKRAGDIIPVIVFAYQRDNYLKKCLDTIFSHMPKSGFQIFVSQDGDHAGVANVARSYGDKVTLFQRERKIIFPEKKLAPDGYYSLAQHYKFGLDKVFSTDPNFKEVIILEEDLEVSPDFFNYFKALSFVLDEDKSLFCISAWNDNGMDKFVDDNRALYRSDFFPGLGWMTTREFWDEVGPKWPLGFWDDWLREKSVRKGRACIRPEVSRTFTFGSQGVSQGQFYEQYLKHIKLNKEPVDWLNMDLSHMEKEAYDRELSSDCEKAESIHVDNLEQYSNQNKHFKMYYSSNQDFISISTKIGVMNDIKAGVPRGAYGGVVTIKYKGNVLHIVPQTGAMKPVTYSNDPPYT